ncbi:MAG: hypothetical protein ACO1QS_01640 [Verrucomicrobiota bacterium]
MNKRQVLYPAVVIGLVLLVGAYVHRQRQRTQFVAMMAGKIGQELVTTTNSVHLDRVGSGLRGQMASLLQARTQVAKVTMGDAPKPLGDGKAHCQLVLTNKLGKGVVIRLQQTPVPEKFHVLGFYRYEEK